MKTTHETATSERTTTRAMKLWVLRPKDRNEPPFHFANVPQIVIVAAESKDEARRIAAGDGTPNSEAWGDENLASCEELRPDAAGVIARDMSA
jgi:hypothetical protein